jgi:uncharacterized damage-inducible protein DinB
MQQILLNGTLIMIHQITREKFDQLLQLVNQFDDDRLRRPLEVLNGSSIGMHIRHILEFYLCLFEAVACKELNYDLRKRDRSMEMHTASCRKCLKYLQKQLLTYPQDFDMQVYADYSLMDDERPIAVKTTYFRELLYNVEHTVHHMAIIKIGLRALGGAFLTGEDFGVAASTVRNNKICAQ